MFDLVDSIQDFLLEGGFEVSKKPFDAFTGIEGSYMLLMPGTVLFRDFDRSKHISQPFQIVVKRIDELQAIEECQAIEDYLDDTVIPSLNGSYRMVKTEVYTTTQKIDLQDEKIPYAYMVRMVSEIVR